MTSPIRARQICETDIPAVADLLAYGFQNRPRHFWLKILTCLRERPAPAGLPRYGYLLESDGVLTHPGYFFDFPQESYLIVSLIVPEHAFAAAIHRVLRHFDCTTGRRASRPQTRR